MTKSSFLQDLVVEILHTFQLHLTVNSGWSSFTSYEDASVVIKRNFGHKMTFCEEEDFAFSRITEPKDSLTGLSLLCDTAP